ncbi:hypothetical protein V2E24_02715 [Mycoplasmopsis ciconiae]|uniref:DUF2304 domain-containing protein n=1 Tax=Mycoplasmopsis ciconiae TaxID=561067 RepID=A0ABU7MNB6_9BACT|nr:hypothetical protein [Mycoplasmopsis ciconiae]
MKNFRIMNAITLFTAMGTTVAFSLAIAYLLDSSKKEIFKAALIIVAIFSIFMIASWTFIAIETNMSMKYGFRKLPIFYLLCLILSFISIGFYLQFFLSWKLSKEINKIKTEDNQITIYSN